jgi:NADH dehydrogenase
VATRRPDRALFLKPLGSVGQIVPMPVAYSRDETITRAIVGADAVINLVGVLTEGPGRRFAALHAQLPGRIGRAAKTAGVGRFIQISSIGAAPTSPASYARSKAAGEAAAREAFPGVTILRPSVVFGPEDTFFNALGSISRVAPAFPLFFSGLPKLEFDGIFLRPSFPNAGANRMQPVYVGDVADAVMAVLRDPGTAGRVYELGGPTVYSFRQVVELALAESGRRRCLLPVPFFALEAAAFFAQVVPFSPLTPDLVRLMKLDNVVAPGAQGLAALGITPAAAELILPTYMHVYRAGRAERPNIQA